MPRDDPAAHIGDLVPNGSIVYRAFAAPGFRDSKKKKVKPYAYLRSKNKPNHKDGLSVGLTPAAAVMGLQENFGYCSLPVTEAHELPDEIEIRIDTQLAGHALIRNMPYADSDDDDERKQALRLAGDLARMCTAETCEKYVP